MTAPKTRTLLSAIALAVTLATPASTAFAQAPQPATGQTGSAQTLDPVALQALKGMGAYLKTLKAFELHTKATLETALENTDLQVHFGYEGTYRVQQPNAFFVQLKSDRTIREYYYDGKTFSVNVPRQKYFATASAPPTIHQTVDDIYLNYGISLPLADLFYWADNPTTDGIEAAMRVGFAKVNGIEADQFVYRGPDLDWQLWIARGKAPLPLKIVITRRSDPARPSYSAELNWDTSPKFPAGSFAFKPDAQSSSIRMAKYTEGK